MCSDPVLFICVFSEVFLAPHWLALLISVTVCCCTLVCVTVVCYYRYDPHPTTVHHIHQMLVDQGFRIFNL